MMDSAFLYKKIREKSTRKNDANMKSDLVYQMRDLKLTNLNIQVKLSF